MANPASHFVCVRAGETRQAVLTVRDRILALAAEDRLEKTA
jgi:hypothetical protein